MQMTQPVRMKWPFWLAAAACLVLLAASPSFAANVLNMVSVAEGANESQVIKLVLKDPVEAMPVSFTTSNPHRLVLDFADTSTGNSIARTVESLNSATIKNYQVVQAGDRTRVVFNLNVPASHEIRKDRNLILVVLQGAVPQTGAPAPASAPARFAEVGKQREYGIRDVDFRRGKNGESRITLSLTDPGVGIDIQQKGRTIQVDFLNTTLPPALQRRLDVADFATPAQLIETFAQGKNTRMLVTPKGKWDYSAHQTGNQFILDIRSLDDPNLAKSDKPQYSGEKLTLNFQNVEVRAVLQVIADFTGLNIIASDTVAGNVTLRLKDVPWDQALDIILRAKGLDQRKSGSVIWVAPRDELAAKEKQELEAKKSLAELEALTTRSYRLNYLRADEAMAVISGDSRLLAGSQEAATCSPSSTGIKADVAAAGSPGSSTTVSQGGGGTTTSTNKVNRVLSDRGGASHDLTTNTLVVTDTLNRHAAIEEVLKSVDLPSKQVMIEARVVLADDQFGRDLGVKLGFQGSGRSGGTNFGVGTYDSSAVAATTGVTAGSPTANVNLTATGAPSLGFTIFDAGAAAILSLELQALEVDNRGKIVSNPRVVTTNLRPAVILQGTQIPYQTVSTEGTQTSFKDALLCLLVSPQVLNNNSIILNVEVTKDAQGVNTTAGPAINVRRVKTQVRVNNGETAVLGGVFEQTVRNDTNKVPLLGDLPFVGNLFKKNSKTDSKSEMLIFLTPRILQDDLLSGR